MCTKTHREMATAASIPASGVVMNGNTPAGATIVVHANFNSHHAPIAKVMTVSGIPARQYAQNDTSMPAALATRGIPLE